MNTTISVKRYSINLLNYVVLLDSDVIDLKNRKQKTHQAM